VPSIWLHDKNQLEKAKALIGSYQKERLNRAREEYAQLGRTGRHRTIGDVIRENPLRFVVYLAAIAALLYFSTKPFLDIGK
jgi:hydroxymethylglutaryl-CoA reductase